MVSEKISSIDSLAMLIFNSTIPPYRFVTRGGQWQMPAIQWRGGGALVRRQSAHDAFLFKAALVNAPVHLHHLGGHAPLPPA